MISYKMIDLPKIAIIGKEGLCTKEKNVSQNLWHQANSNFGDVADLGMKNPDGSFVGFWGAMSDETMSFMPWTDDCDRCDSGKLWGDISKCDSLSDSGTWDETCRGRLRFY